MLVGSSCEDARLVAEVQAPAQQAIPVGVAVEVVVDDAGEAQRHVAEERRVLHHVGIRCGDAEEEANREVNDIFDAIQNPQVELQPRLIRVTQVESLSSLKNRGDDLVAFRGMFRATSCSGLAPRKIKNHFYNSSLNVQSLDW